MRRNRIIYLVLSAILPLFVCPLLAPTSAHAQLSGQFQLTKAAPPARTWFNMRAGAATSSTNGRPTICVELSPLERVSIESCGTGSGILHSDPGAEIAHFRLNVSAMSWRFGDQLLKLRVGLGMAELQLAPDEPGFDFGDPDVEDAIETAGPEAAVGVQWTRPIGLGFEFVGDLKAGAAWLPGARKLITPMAALQPFSSISLGVGW
ncbi:MAG: hypothetical protein KC502_08480 [Myxococcales bacterium]|nr:hypothetical protein [Myxococcales bacterium]